jgi:RimJ/RimL family protein N-acetyltransferase
MKYPKGPRLYVRKPEETDISIIANWLADPAFIRNLYGSLQQSEEDRILNVHTMLQQNAKDSSLHLSLIACKHDNSPIGLIQFKNINWKHRTVEMNAAIGHPSNRDFVYGPELYFLALLTAFNELNLHKVFGYTYEHNTKAIRLNNFGAEQEGILREHLYQDGVFHDVIIYAIFKDQFEDFIQAQKNSLLKRYFQEKILK